MKALIFFVFIMAFIPATVLCQPKIKQLKTFCTTNFDPDVTVTVPSIRMDKCQAAYLLKNALVENGFKVIDPSVADDQVRRSNPPKIYSIRFTYNYNQSSKCAPYAMLNMTGQVIDMLHEGVVVATFSFKQGEWSLGAKCTQDIMEALAYALKTKTNNK